MFLLMTDTDPDELGEALARVEDSRTSNGGAGGIHALATGVQPQGSGQGVAAGLDRTAEAMATLAADVTTKAISLIIINSSGLRSPSYSISSNGVHSLPRNSSSLRSTSSSHSSSSNHQDILAGGNHRVFVSVATSPDISMQNIELYLPRR